MLERKGLSLHKEATFSPRLAGLEVDLRDGVSGGATARAEAVRLEGWLMWCE